MVRSINFILHGFLPLMLCLQGLYFLKKRMSDIYETPALKIGQCAFPKWFVPLLTK